jgi:hypothetical protein
MTSNGFGWRGGVAALVAISFAAGCQEDSGEFRTITGVVAIDPGEVRPVPGQEGRCEAGPIDFGAIEVGRSETRRPRLINAGELKFRVAAADLAMNTAGDEFRAEPLAEAVDLGPGEDLPLLVTYVPGDLGDDRGVLGIETDEPSCRHVDLVLQGSGKSGEIDVCLKEGPDAERCNVAGEPLALDFGSVRIGFMKLALGRVVNGGDIPLRFTVLPFDVGDELTTDLPLGEEVTMAPGRARDFTFTFTPRGARPQAGRFEIVSNDHDENPIVLTVSGGGDGPAICAAPLTLDFGEVPVGRSVTGHIDVSSCGTRPLNLHDSEFRDESSAAEIALATPVEPFPDMRPGDRVRVEFRYAPVDLGLDEAQLAIDSDDTLAAHTTLVIRGRGTTPDECFVTIGLTRLDFGAVAPGVTTTRTTVLANAGAMPCTVTRLAGPTAAPGTQEGEFKVEGAVAPFGIGPGETRALVVAYTPLDTGVDEASLVVHTTDPLVPELTVLMRADGGVPPFCELEIDPGGGRIADGYLNFGRSGLGQAVTRPVKLTNEGTAYCAVTGARVHCDDLSATGQCDPPPFAITAPARERLGPGESTSVEVTFTPTHLGAVGIAVPGFDHIEHALVIDTDDDDHRTPATRVPGVEPGTYVIGLGGAADAGSIEVVPRRLGFGVVTRGCRSAEECLKVYNLGGAPIRVTGLRAEPGDVAAGTGPFRVVRAPAFPATIDAGQSVEVCLAYHPDVDSGVETGRLVILAEAENATMVPIELSGEATLSAHQTDSFRQLDDPKVDVLFVIDNSGSMGEEQENVAANFERFLGAAAASGFDYQIGIITTEVNEAEGGARPGTAPGVLFGGERGVRIIRRDTPEALAVFRDNVRVGLCCSDEQEAGLQAARLALGDPPPAENAGFLRADAKLAILFVSDEQDQSDGPVDFYADYFQSLKGFRNTALFDASAITGEGPSGCSGPGGGAEFGSRYIDVATRSGGLFRSICTTNWGRELADLGVLTFGVQVEFLLTRPARPGSIVVVVNGRRQTMGFSYDSVTNSIVYEDAQVPARGALITVDYDVACLR